MIGATTLGGGYILASLAPGLPSFSAAYLLIGTFGIAATFVPLMANISFWFEQRRGIAIALCASGNYISGAVWPTVIEAAIRTHGWRATHLAAGLFCLIVMPPLAMLLRGPQPGPSRRSANAACLQRTGSICRR